jgi:PPK2 family polyphosphate:nucleotide phosphotransferase
MGPSLRHPWRLYTQGVIAKLRVEPGTKPQLAKRDTADDLGLDGKEQAYAQLDGLRHQLEVLQQRLYAESERAVLLVLQGLDAAGKDGVVRRVFEGLNPQSCRVASFKVPTSTELAHDYLWRVHAALPQRGEIGIFNRSHYEDVVAVRLLGLQPERVWKRRPGHIRDWERMLVDEGTTIVKVFLNVSKEEQRKRLQERLDDPEKRWKFRMADLDVRARFDEYVAAYDDVIEQTSTDHAPWYVVPADHNWVKATAVAKLLVDALERIDPQLPEPEEGLDGIVVT